MAIPMKKVVLWTVGLAIVGVGGYFSFKEQPVPVDLVAVQSAPMEVTIDTDGTTRIRNVFEVSAPVSGTALRSVVGVGDFVFADETVVAIIEPAQPIFLDSRSRLQAEAAVKEAEAALRLSEFNIAAAEASHEYASNQYERTKALTDSNTLSSSALDEAELLLEQSRTTLVSALSERTLRLSSLERAQAMLIEPDSASMITESCCIEILAPVDGSILTVSSHSERSVLAGSPLVSIGLLDDLELVVDLLSTDVVNITAGATAYIERWGSDVVLTAEVSKIEPSAFTKISALGIAEQRVRVILDLTSPETQYNALGDGFSVFVRVVEWKTEDTLQIPISALFREDDNWMVFRVVDGIATATAIEIGERNSSVAQIIEGLSEGDVVITHPSDRVANGVKIINRTEIDG